MAGINRYQSVGSLAQSVPGTSPVRTKTHQGLIDDSSRTASQASGEPDTLLLEMDRAVSERLPGMAAGNKKTTLRVHLRSRSTHTLRLMNNSDDFMLPSELEPAWPPSDDDIEAMELDAYDRQKLDDLIEQELWRESLPSVPTPAELNPNLK